MEMGQLCTAGVLVHPGTTSQVGADGELVLRVRDAPEAHISAPSAQCVS